MVVQENGKHSTENVQKTFTSSQNAPTVMVINFESLINLVSILGYNGGFLFIYMDAILLFLDLV